MTSNAELQNRVMALEYHLRAICNVLDPWVKQEQTVVYKSTFTLEEIHNNVIPLGMILSIIYTIVYNALGLPLPKVGSWDEMFRIVFPNKLKEPEECDTLMTIFKSLERRSPQNEAS